MGTVAWKLKDQVLKDSKASEQKFKEGDEEARQYKVILQARVVRKVPKELHAIPLRVVHGFFDNKAFLHSTNEQVMETVSAG